DDGALRGPRDHAVNTEFSRHLDGELVTVVLREGLGEPQLRFGPAGGGDIRHVDAELGRCGRRDGSRHDETLAVADADDLTDAQAADGDGVPRLGALHGDSSADGTRL